MNSYVSDEELFILQRMIDGDEIAFKYFFDTYYDDLCNFVNSYLRDKPLSEDIVQGIFIYLWDNRSSLPRNCSVKSYLYTASKNRSLNQIRDTKNRNDVLEKLYTCLQVISEENTEQSLELKELKEIITKAVDELPQQCKTIYQLSRNEGLTNKEIAEKLGLSIKTVENQITIAIRKIKDFLQPYHYQIFILFIFFNFPEFFRG